MRVGRKRGVGLPTVHLESVYKVSPIYQIEPWCTWKEDTDVPLALFLQAFLHLFSTVGFGFWLLKSRCGRGSDEHPPPVSWITAVVVWSDPILPLVTLRPCLRIAPSADSFGNVSGAKEYPQTCGLCIRHTKPCVKSWFPVFSFFLLETLTWFWWVLSWILTAYKGRWRWAELRGPLQWAGS